MSPKLIKWQEFTKIVREHSANKTLIFISKVAIIVLDEVKDKHTDLDFMKQVDIAKDLFLQNPEKYYLLDNFKKKHTINIII